MVGPVYVQDGIPSHRHPVGQSSPQRDSGASQVSWALHPTDASANRIDDEDVTWDSWEIYIQQQAGAVLVTTEKLPKGSIIKRHPCRQRASQKTCEGERSPMPTWTIHSKKKKRYSLCIQQRAEGETPKPPLLGYNKARCACAFQARC